MHHESEPKDLPFSREPAVSMQCCEAEKSKALVYHLLGFSSMLLSLCLLALHSNKSGVCPSQSHRVLALVLDHNILAEAVTYDAIKRLKLLLHTLKRHNSICCSEHSHVDSAVS